MRKSALLILFVTVFLDLLGFGMVLPMLPYYATEVGANAFAVGALLSVYSLAQFAFSPVWGALSDRVGRRPVLLAFGYYRCPNLCDLTLHAIASATAKVSLRVGRDYAVAFVSIATDETPADAREARDMLLRMSPQGEVDRWHWMTAAAPSIAALTRAAGFRYFKDPRDGQYVHPAGIVIVSPDGRATQYFPGVDYDAHALRLALVDASQGKLGNVIDRLVLLCCGYDPSTGRYSLLISRIMIAVGCAFLLAMALGALWLRRRTP